MLFQPVDSLPGAESDVKWLLKLTNVGGEDCLGLRPTAEGKLGMTMQLDERKTGFVSCRDTDALLYLAHEGNFPPAILGRKEDRRLCIGETRWVSRRGGIV